MRAGALGLALLAATPAWAGAVEYAALRNGQARYWLASDSGSDSESMRPAPEARLDPRLQTPLGSVWKLFVYVYLIDRRLDSEDYVCGGNSRDEVYCCAPGGSIGREAALARSCGLYFQPHRLGIAAADWRRYWQARAAPAWLRDLSGLQPGTLVGVESLLQALASVPEQPRRAAGGALLASVLGARDTSLLREFGARLRAKTWSWHQADKPDRRIGGAAGWLADGTPIWLRAAGPSHVALPVAARHFPATLRADAGTLPGECVRVGLFARYPLQGVEDAAGRPVRSGVLRGRYLARFANGNRLAFSSDGEIEQLAGPRLVATLAVNDYVARVLEREAAPQPEAAARALAIVARTYLYQNAGREMGCLAIDDSSASQRVAPSPPSAAARAIANWSDSLVLDGVPVQYHLDQPGPNRLAWREAEARAQRGEPFDRILAGAFPRASLVSTDSPLATDCEHLAGAEHWLSARLRQWQRALAGEDGFEPVPAPAVCRLRQGNPYADLERGRIYARGLDDREARLTLAHEYLHLAFKQHPRGLDEGFIEATARRLQVEGQP
ncbi:MAG: DUF2300 domain-containing protein [Thiobacillus sp.]|nr:DUF2300 domain-containing protein [Thiobacillus sp.]